MITKGISSTASLVIHLGISLAIIALTVAYYLNTLSAAESSIDVRSLERLVMAALTVLESPSSVNVLVKVPAGVVIRFSGDGIRISGIAGISSSLDMTCRELSTERAGCEVRVEGKDVIISLYALSKENGVSFNDEVLESGVFRVTLISSSDLRSVRVAVARIA